MKALLFDTETTGLIENRTVKNDKLPELIEFYGCTWDLAKDKKINELDQLVRPSSPEAITELITSITGLKWEDVKDAPTFKDVASKIIKLIEASPIVIGHNLSFDIEMIDIEAERCGLKVNWPKIRICTVEQTVHLKGHRLNLSGLHELLFGEKFEGAHRAKVDVMALKRCCVELIKKGIL